MKSRQGVWLVLQHATLGPFFAIFSAPARVSNGHDATLFNPPQTEETGNRGLGMNGLFVEQPWLYCNCHADSGFPASDAHYPQHR